MYTQCKESRFIEELRVRQSEFHLVLAEHPFFRRLSTGEVTRDQYIAYLSQTRFFVEQTLPLLLKCGQQLTLLDRHEELASLFREKAAEEDSHELMIDKDIAAIGGDLTSALGTGPDPWVRAYIAWNQAVSTSDNPAGCLGSAYVLEALSIEYASMIEQSLLSRSSIEAVEKGVLFLHVHGTEDIGHVEELEKFLSTLDNPRDIDIILLTAATTRQFYVGMMDHLADKFLLRQ